MRNEITVKLRVEVDHDHLVSQLREALREAMWVENLPDDMAGRLAKQFYASAAQVDAGEAPSMADLVSEGACRNLDHERYTVSASDFKISCGTLPSDLLSPQQLEIVKRQVEAATRYIARCEKPSPMSYQWKAEQAVDDLALPLATAGHFEGASDHEEARARTLEIVSKHYPRVHEFNWDFLEPKQEVEQTVFPGEGPEIRDGQTLRIEGDAVSIDNKPVDVMAATRKFFR